MYNLIINGDTVVSHSYRPRGLRKEGSSEELEAYWLLSGAYEIDVEMMDDGANWRQTFTESAEILPGESLVLYYDEESDQFVAR